MSGAPDKIFFQKMSKIQVQGIAQKNQVMAKGE